jgi:hypothetical protein
MCMMVGTAQVRLCPPYASLLGWTGKGTTEPLSFVPNVTNLSAEASELVCDLQDEKCDHGYWPPLKIRRSI